MAVYLLTGPPCSGKSTLAAKLAKPEDPVLDFDTICTQIDGRQGWEHIRSVRDQADAYLNRRTSQLRYHQGDAWLIRCAPEADTRRRLAADLEATVYLLNPGRAECLRRARADGRPPHTVVGIHHWYDRFRPCEVDMTPPDAI